MAEKRIIQSYGLRWREADVFWGAGSSSGRLWGVPDDKTSAEPTDFREQIGIYILYSGNDLIYVGQAGSGKDALLNRLKQHRETKSPLAGRWDSFSWFGLRRAINKGRALSKVTMTTSTTINQALNHVEAVLIAATEPPMNKKGGNFGGDTKQYLQVRDERLTTPREMLEQVLEQLDEIKRRP